MKAHASVIDVDDSDPRVGGPKHAEGMLAVDSVIGDAHSESMTALASVGDSKHTECLFASGGLDDRRRTLREYECSRLGVR